MLPPVAQSHVDPELPVTERDCYKANQEVHTGGDGKRGREGKEVVRACGRSSGYGCKVLGANKKV